MAENTTGNYQTQTPGCDALCPRCAQAAPVLAAVGEWRRLRFREEGMDAAATLDEAYESWRAARKG